MTHCFLKFFVQDCLKNYVWMDDDHIADVFDDTKPTSPAEEAGAPSTRRNSGSSSNFNVSSTFDYCSLALFPQDLQLSIGDQMDDRVEVLPERNTASFE